jgi:hypothetical protein
MKAPCKAIGIGSGGLVLASIAFAGGYVSAQGTKPSDAVAAKIGQQLVASYTMTGIYETPLPDHLWLKADDQSVLFLHFDKPLGEATRLLYVGYGIKGRWCAEDQARAESIAGKGFTHFHRIAKVATADAGHGGSKPGEAGYWLKHVAVGPGFEMPWGHVAHGTTDAKFMPTTAPKCGS